MSKKQKTKTVLSTSKKYSHLYDTGLFLNIINDIASAAMPWDLTRKYGMTTTELKVLKNSQEYHDFKEEYFSGVREAVEYSHKEQLKIFSKYDKEILRELSQLALNADKEVNRLQAMKIYLQHSGDSRGQLQDKEYQELKELVEVMATNQDGVG